MISLSLLAVLQSRGCALGRLLHQSNSSAVYEAGWQGRGAAVKLLYVTSPETWVQIDRELRTLMTMQHPKVLRLYDYVWHCEGGSTVLAIITELCEKDLERELHERKRACAYWTEAELWTWLQDMTAVLAQLQHQSVAHRDIKLGNFFISRGHYKLGDFGSAKSLHEAAALTVTGTPLFLSPQLRQALLRGCSHVEHDVFRSDVYSLGVVLLCMAKLEAPLQAIFSVSPEESFATEIEHLNYSDSLKSVLKHMLAWEESERFDFIQLEQWLTQPISQPETCPICLKKTELRESSFVGTLNGGTVVCCSQQCAAMLTSLKTLRAEYMCPHCHSELNPVLCRRITEYLQDDLDEYSVTEQCPVCHEDFDLDAFSRT